MVCRKQAVEVLLCMVHNPAQDLKVLSLCHLAHLLQQLLAHMGDLCLFTLCPRVRVNSKGVNIIASCELAASHSRPGPATVAPTVPGPLYVHTMYVLALGVRA